MYSKITNIMVKRALHSMFFFRLYSIAHLIVNFVMLSVGILN